MQKNRLVIEHIQKLCAHQAVQQLGGIADGGLAYVLARLAVHPKRQRPILFVARDGQRLEQLNAALKPLISAKYHVTLPAWDCLPYDRLSPNMVVSAMRMAALYRLAHQATIRLVTLSVNAFIQKLPPKSAVVTASLMCEKGAPLEMENLVGWAQQSGYVQVPNVREQGEYSVRGGLMDVFASGHNKPVRFDFFGAELDTIRSFDPETQRAEGQLDKISLYPLSEISLDKSSIAAFRTAYLKAFGGDTTQDALYHAISAGHRFPGAEHWLPFFYGRLDHITDYVSQADLILDYQADQAFGERVVQIEDYYQARLEHKQVGEGPDYKPVKPDTMFCLDEIAHHRPEQGAMISLSPFEVPEAAHAFNLEMRAARHFGPERKAGNINLYEATIGYFKQLCAQQAQVFLACVSLGSATRLVQIFNDHGFEELKLKPNLRGLASDKPGFSAVVWPLETGFTIGKLYVIAEKDILGTQLIRRRNTLKKNNALTETSGLAAGALVVHVDHGIGRFVGLRAVDVAGAPHDCVDIEYANHDRLLLPVENIELLCAYGAQGENVALDRLGGAAWQAKKAKLKQRIRVMADQLIKIAAERAVRQGIMIKIPQGAYEEFAAQFGFEETPDQLEAIADVFNDMNSGKPMDRLICGDVGFGKTEVALRAAFAAAMHGKQVAVIVPTTLLARQHYKNFKKRFEPFPVNVAQASRLVGQTALNKVRDGLKNGDIDIVIGTHALLSDQTKFADLGLLIVDEEQHFGVAHKEKLKNIKANVHVLTLSATPIPRTLQMALTGVRELSLLTTPPVDRLAIRTFIAPFDTLSVREALLREKYRAGQSFYVCPRIKDQADIVKFLTEYVPEISFVVANGKMRGPELDDIMTQFYDGQFDVLVATTIVESGLDVPNANTLIVHRADQFGLAQLYQIRGRIGRAKTRAYALFTLPMSKILTETAKRRLEVLQSLQSLGSGLELASHDMDIRGAGNLLGDEQSGHIRDVGYELYQSMLEEAVAAQKERGMVEDEEGLWSPQIALGMPVMIAEKYVPDLQVRMQLYRRLGELEDKKAIDAFSAELVDRFGPQPEDVVNLLRIVYIKILCRQAHIEKIDAGPKGLVMSFRRNQFPSPEGLVTFIELENGQARLKSDHKLIVMREFKNTKAKLIEVARVLGRLAALAANKRL